VSENDATLTPAQHAVVRHGIAQAAVVEAGAGTGKTFTIVERVAALHEQGICRADKILLLTFAKKAAAELRARIARRLHDIAPTCSTFHAFAWSLLRDHAYEVGMAPETEVLEDVEARVEFKRAFDEFLEDPAGQSAGFPMRAFNQEEIRRELFSIDQQLKQRNLSIDAFEERALEAASAFESAPYRELRKPYLKPQRGKEWSVELRQSEEQFRAEIAWELERVQACAGILRRFAARLAARHALTYADLLVRAQQALRERPQLRAEFQRRYACCIVDEYQDTDLSQHRLLEALFGEELGGVMVVGDTLQSIFSFRGARPENFALFLDRPAVARYALAHNRRSRQEILDLAHATIAVAHPEAQALEGQRGPAGEQVVFCNTVWEASDRYLPIEVAREREAEAVTQRIAALLASGTTVDTGAGPEPISPRHIAILSRTKRNVQPVTEALVMFGIPFKLVGGVGFYDAPEIRDTLAWMRLLANPFDSLAVARALQSSAIGASDAAVARLGLGLEPEETAFARRALLDALPEGDALAGEAAAAASALRNLLDELAPHAALPLSTALAAVIEATRIAQEAAASDDPRAAQALANIAKLEALARSFAESSPAAQAADFVSFIEELENVDFDEREADVTAAEAVTISTIHAAKGLEWPFVFVLGVWPQLAPDSRLFVDDASGALLYAENPDGGRSFHYQSVKLRADAHGYIPRDLEKEQPEELRLFYVALTRARDRVYVSGPRLHPSKSNPSGKPHDYFARLNEGLAARGWPTEEPAPKDAPPYARRLQAQAVNGSARPVVRKGRATRGEDKSRLAVALSYSLIARYERCPRQAAYRTVLRLPDLGAQGRAASVSRDDDVDGLEPLHAAPIDSLQNAGEYGQTLHKALELWAADRRDGRAPADPAAYLDAALRTVGAGPSRSQREEALHVLGRIQRELSGWKPLHVEAPFTLDFGEHGTPALVFGYLDLIARDEAGRACLVDYKTGEPSPDHGLQLALYRLAAREVYRIEIERCLIGRIAGATFTLEPIDPVHEPELRARIRAVREGLERGDERARPGAWCWSCVYRNAPCRDYPRTSSRPQPEKATV